MLQESLIWILHISKTLLQLLSSCNHFCDILIFLLVGLPFNVFILVNKKRPCSGTFIRDKCIETP